jgi:hypothetical protein
MPGCRARMHRDERSSYEGQAALKYLGQNAVCHFEINAFRSFRHVLFFRRSSH